MVNVTTISITLGGPLLNQLLSNFSQIFNSNKDLQSLPRTIKLNEKYAENIDKYLKLTLLKQQSDQKLDKKNALKSNPQFFDNNISDDFEQRRNYLFYSRNSHIIINFNCSFFQRVSLDPLIGHFRSCYCKTLLLAVSSSAINEFEDWRHLANNLNSNFIYSDLEVTAFSRIIENRSSNLGVQKNLKLGYIEDLNMIKNEPIKSFKVCFVIFTDKKSVNESKYKKILTNLENDNFNFFEIGEDNRIGDLSRLFSEYLMDDYKFSDKSIFRDELESYFRSNTKA